MTAWVMGCAQLGGDYGATNRQGAMNDRQARELLETAWELGVRHFDTAQAYGLGESERRLGEFLQTVGREARTAEVVTKLWLPDDILTLPPAALGAEADQALQASVQRLRMERLPAVLLHRTEYLFHAGGVLWQSLCRWQDQGRVGRIGISINSPEELASIAGEPRLQQVQLPYNLLDGRWDRADIATLAASRPEIVWHARSIYLQGLLLEADTARWPGVTAAENARVLSLWQGLQHAQAMTAEALCMGYVKAAPWVDGVVVGCETPDQLRGNAALFRRPALSPETCQAIRRHFADVPDILVTPYRWKAAS